MIFHGDGTASPAPEQPEVSLSDLRLVLEFVGIPNPPDRVWEAAERLEDAISPGDGSDWSVAVW